MARSLALIGLLALAAPLAHAGEPTRLRMKALNQSAAVINMTDDITFGTLSWTPKTRYVFDDDVKIDGTLSVDKIKNKEVEDTMDKVQKILDCNQNMEIYDQSTGQCNVVSSKRHNMKVKDMVASASYHFCMIMWDDTLRCWGYFGEYSMGGFADGTYRFFPTQSPVSYDQPIRRHREYRMLPAAETYYNIGAVKADGTVWMTGYGGNGQMGQGHTSNRGYFVQTNYLSNVTSLVGGGHSSGASFIAMENGVLYCWGYNGYGQCGVGHTSTVKSPTRVLALSNVKTYWINNGNSASCACAVLYDGTAWCWGYNGYGQLANGGTGNRDSPTQVGSAVELYLTDVDYIRMNGGDVATTLALRKDGTVWAWGYGGHGQTGTGSNSNRNRAFQVTDQSGLPLKDIVEIAPCNGQRYAALCARKKDGSVWCWGYNGRGNLGLGHTSNRNRAYQVQNVKNAAQIENPPQIEHSYGYASVCIRTTRESGGEVWCWGYNNRGQLGVGDTSQRNSPVRVMNIGSVSLLGSRSYHGSNGDTTFYALSDDGYTVWSWGYSGHGQVGSHTVAITANRIGQKVRLT